jgi:nucleoside-diphosphate-sugar epimerase
VRALLRGPADAAACVGGAEPWAGDLRNAESVRRAAAGCDAVFHTAAVVTGGGSWPAYQELNVRGTQAVIAAARDAGARLLHLSSVAVFGPARYADPTRPVDEATPLAPLAEGDFYGRSKRESERLVLEAHDAGTLWATTIRPCVIYGPRDRQFVPRVARMIATGLAPLVGAGARRFAVVHAANVADAAVRAVATEAAGGKAYVTANDFDVAYVDFVRLAAAGLERRVRLVPVPYGVAALGVAAARRAATAAGHHDTAGRLRAALDFVARDNPFSSALARRELGWTPAVAPTDGVPEAFAWWQRTTGTARGA